ATTHNFSGSSLTGSLTGTLDVVNAAASPYGAGWSIGGLQQVFNSSSTGPALITAGSQGTEQFDYRAAESINDLAVIGPDPNQMNQATDVRLWSNDGMGNFSGPATGPTAPASPVVAGA